jgi:hypothetical protein
MSNQYRKFFSWKEAYKLTAGVVCKNGEPMTAMQIGKELNNLKMNLDHQGEEKNELLIRIDVLNEILERVLPKQEQGGN